jgi:hypothetical protein
MLLGLHETAQRVVGDARAIAIPTQLLISGADLVVRQGPQHEFFVKLGAATKERHVLPGFYHDTLGEKGRGPVIAKVREFLLQRFAAPIERPSLRDAHRVGHPRRSRSGSPADRLGARVALRAATRAGLRFGARLSHGFAVGQRTGFDSGSMLDYVYRNEAERPRPIGACRSPVSMRSVGVASASASSTSRS